MTKKLILSVIILLMTVTSVLAREQKSEGPLVIAISTDFQPFTFLNAAGEPAGMFVDIWRLWAQKTGKQIEFISSDWKTSLENLKNQKADIHSGLFYSSERSAWMSDFRPFYEVGVNLFYPHKQGRISDLKELSGQTVAAVRGTQPEQFLKNYPGIRVLSCATREELVKVVREGKAKGFVIVFPVGKSLIDRMGVTGDFDTLGKVLYSEKIRPGVLRNNPALLALVEKGLNAISSQEWADIEARWIPDPAKRQFRTSRLVRLTPAEQTWLENHKTIRVGIAPIFPPLKFIEDGVIKGIEPDYLSLLSEYTGIKFEHVVCDLAVMDAKVKSGDLDMFLSFHIPERLPYMTFTEPFLEFKQVIVTRSDAPFISGIGALRGKKVATVKGVKLYDKLLGPHPDIEVVQVDTMEQMFRAVAESQADALISKTYFVGYLLQNYPNLKIAGVIDLPPEPYLYAVRKDYPELVGILNKAIKSIPKDRADTLVQKWFSVRLEYHPNWFEILKWSIVTGGAFSFVLWLTLFWNRRLVREIDKRRRTEEVLRESEAKFRTLVETATEGVWVADRDHRTAFVNTRMAEMLGFLPEEMLGRDLASFIVPEDTGKFAEQMKLRQQGIGSQYELRLRRKDGGTVCGLVSGTSLQDSQGVAGDAFAMVTDITERKQFEQKLQEKNAELERFNYTVSHDLKSPLITIQGYAGMILGDLQAGDHARIQGDLQMIRDAAEKMTDLLNDLLELSRLGKQMHAPSPIDMNRLVEDALLQLDGPVKQHRVDVVVQPDLPATLGDQKRIGEVVQNLVENAIKYRGDQPAPRIEIGFRQDGEEIVFFVADNGAGIDLLHHERIFGLFNKLDPASDGTGVGLALVKRIVELHGGRVWVESAGVGTGSRFCFTLPG